MTRIPRWGAVALGILLELWLTFPASSAEQLVLPPQVALYFGANPPLDELQAFDLVVLDPLRAPEIWPQASHYPHTRWLARIELPLDSQDSGAALENWLATRVKPNWELGYRGFLVRTTPSASATHPQVQGAPIGSTGSDQRLETALRALRTQYPAATLLLQDQVEFVTAHPGLVQGLVIDSLLQNLSRTGGWSLATDPLEREVRQQALQHLHRLDPNLEIVEVEFCQRSDQLCRRQTARQVAAAGRTPYVTDPEFQSVGIGQLEVVPRRILVVQALPAGAGPETGAGAQWLGMPLDYLGYLARYVNLNETLPPDIESDRYAGIVAFIDHPVQAPERWRQWLLERIQAGIKVAIFQQLGFELDSRSSRQLGLEAPDLRFPSGSKLQIESVDPILSFETPAQATAGELINLHATAAGARILGKVRVAGQESDLAALLPWGGYVLAPFCTTSLGGTAQDSRSYWVVQPLDFLRSALQLPEFPVPDVTTENGRRLWFTQVDGDGFPSRTEFAGPAYYGAEALYQRIFVPQRLPVTISVVEGEIGPSGLYPQLSGALESIAKRIFALPQVEIGSHSYAHPLDWVEARAPMADPATVLSLPIAGYRFSPEREIQGSIAYINQRLAPPGKTVRLMQWTGNANPTPADLRLARQSGVLNINGGFTDTTNSNPSWRQISGTGIDKGDGSDDALYQVYAAQMNENIFTEEWTRPFYGLQRALETYARTDRPLRLKPVDLYYHFFSGTKLASLTALERVYHQLQQQSLFPLFTSDYVQRVLDSRHTVIARLPTGWRVRTGSALRELRLPPGRYPRLADARGVIGYSPGPGGSYVHLSESQAEFADTAQDAANSTLPYLASANGIISAAQRQPHGLSFALTSYGQPQFQIHNATGCRARVDGIVQTELPSQGALALTLPSALRLPPPSHLIGIDCE